MDFMPETTAGRAYQIIIGKLTDRQRRCVPFGMVETTSSSSSGGGGGEGNSAGDGGCMLIYGTTDQSKMMSSEEEEDMANCLIMLAQSVSPAKDDNSELHCQKTEKLKNRRLKDMAATTAGGKSGFHNYECKTCNRAFPSFQALGGHRASHKKPKITVADRNSVSTKMEISEGDQPDTNISKPPSPPPGFIQTGYNNSKGKVHECSICGSEFLSGQALGGHMRRHRTAPPSSNQIVVSTNMNDRSSDHIIEKSPMLSLDLNHPAPEVVDDIHSNFHFSASSSQHHLVFSAPALVHCHY